ncbi:alpha/beta-hydrolase [Microstroma glucosiphilum]|uniref:Alpha/beta-hydrolase n=1 Tax=Pseudomicrostroma glucosiphilum TaxID=1684307 RepID=A0A316U126_9BASI|nr:alpha/beta-hydrolase [Pseudomicrostroma glucosiphilum]PWN18574.1 alpha/beta-hydrolase [Pseudomicrostroma glucosiphilum]
MSSSSLPFTRQDISIPSHTPGQSLSAWLYLPLSSTQARHPTLLLGHGLGGLRTFRLDAYATFFAREGFLVILFDYRYWGSSGGEPRGLISPARQEEDWESALSYALKHDSVDADKIGLLGSSFGGGHVIRIASKHPKEVKATVSQCPFTDGIASAATVGWKVLPQLAFWGLLDLAASFVGGTVRVKLIAKPGEVALMNAPDAVPGYLALRPSNVSSSTLTSTAIPARLCLQLPMLRPGASAAQIQTPILFAICGKDSVAPIGPTLKYARQAKRGEVKLYEDMGHFDIYIGEAYDKATRDYLAFFKKNLMAG